ncbi:hypothetical protein N9D31_00235 [Oligoflexaceae bacterium]|nr:hypothetical protein [Oligoflexaceae bacterium]
MSFIGEYGYLVVLVLLLAGILYRLLWSPASAKDKYEAPWQSQPELCLSRLRVDLHAEGIHHQSLYCDFPDIWKDAMKSYGMAMKKAGVEQVYFVNGTYAGFDPIDLINLAKNLFPRLPERFIAKVQAMNVAGLNRIVKDTGNFLDRYVDLFSESVDLKKCDNFKWSSANHHAARVEGAIQLLASLGEKVRKKEISSEARILFVGHSHAGQVFSLITQILYDPDSSKLKEIIYDNFMDKSLFDAVLRKTKDLRFDFVTLGMPPRYKFIENINVRLMHIINHRGKAHRAGSLKGIFHTRDGDYVQQLGIRGTDNAAFVPKLRVANQKLNAILDGGVNMKRWVADIKLRNRVPRYGWSFLIDYKDQSIARPNLFKTIFGHGTYTETRFMEFNTRVIVKHFYQS